MFLLKRGLRYLLIQSQRDGRGSVRQRRIWRFGSARELREHLEGNAWKALQESVRKAFPELQPDWETLRERAKAAVADAEPPRRAPQLVRAGQKLAASLEAEHDPRLLRQAQQELSRLCLRIEDRLRGIERGPRRLEKAEKLAAAGELARAEKMLSKVEPQPESLEVLARVLEGQGRPEEALEARSRRVKLRPDVRGRLELGAALHRSGRLGEAVEQYRQIPTAEAARYYHEGAAWLQAGNPEAALVPLLRGMARDQRIVRALKWRLNFDYWTRYGDLWTPEARQFLLSLAADTLVGHSFGTLNRQGPRVRWPVPRRSLESLLKRVLARRLKRPSIEAFEPRYRSFPIRPRRDRPQPMTYRRQLYLERNPWYKDLVLPPPPPPKRKHPRARLRLREEARARKDST